MGMMILGQDRAQLPAHGATQQPHPRLRSDATQRLTYAILPPVQAQGKIGRTVRWRPWTQEHRLEGILRSSRNAKVARGKLLDISEDPKLLKGRLGKLELAINRWHGTPPFKDVEKET